MIVSFLIENNEIIKKIISYTKEDVKGNYEGERCAYKLVIKTNKRTFVYEGCHDEVTPSFYFEEE